MANPTMTLIGTPYVVGSGGAASVTLSSIPNTYTDLFVKWTARSNRSGANGDGLIIQFNGVTTSYATKILYGDGNSGSSATDVSVYGSVDGNGATANIFSNGEVYIPNYTSSNYKSFSADSVTETNAGGSGSGYQAINAGLWSNTAAITSIYFAPSVGTSFLQYTTFWLYGIKNS